MNLTIYPNHFLEITKKGYTLDQIYLMKLIQNGEDISSLCEGSVKIAAVHSSLVRKGLITDQNKITLTGLGVLSFLETTEIKLVTKKPEASNFDLWWKAFPGTDIFEHKGKSFKGCRNLKARKEDCKLKLTNILNEGEYTIEQLVGALEFDVLGKKNQSVVSGSNNLTYMQNSFTYLHQRTFEPFIELIGTKKEEVTSFKGTDI